jgi:hypothetical protein
VSAAGAEPALQTLALPGMVAQGRGRIINLTG